MVDILNFDRDALVDDLSQSLALPRFRADQLIHWLYRRRFTDFGEMTNISAQVRAELSSRYRVFRPIERAIQQSTDGTRKYLFEMGDGEQIESVLIRQPKRYTLCVSSQVGCAIGCRFCRTALMKLRRNLETAEIVGQVLAVQDDIARRGAAPFDNIVFMGMGEPLHNLDQVVRAVSLLNDEHGFNFSGRKITISTSGLVPGIKKLGESKCRANLAVSLNATTDEVRDQLIPINRKWPIAVLLEALRSYPLLRRQRITIEYVLLAGVNDTEDDLHRLPGLLRGIPVKVNLIPYNVNAGLGFDAPSRDVIERWQRSLLAAGLNATIRWSKGDDISAACGQLATEAQP